MKLLSYLNRFKCVHNKAVLTSIMLFCWLIPFVESTFNPTGLQCTGYQSGMLLCPSLVSLFTIVGTITTLLISWNREIIEALSMNAWGQNILIKPMKTNISYPETLRSIWIHWYINTPKHTQTIKALLMTLTGLHDPPVSWLILTFTVDFHFTVSSWWMCYSFFIWNCHPLYLKCPSHLMFIHSSLSICI